jgi:hypothetical protein
MKEGTLLTMLTYSSSSTFPALWICRMLRFPVDEPPPPTETLDAQLTATPTLTSLVKSALGDYQLAILGH